MIIYISGLCRGREGRPSTCRGATAYAPFDGPVGPNKYVRVPIPVGTSVGRMQGTPLHGYPAKLPCLGRGRPYTDAAKPAGFHTKNRFEARNPPRIAPKINLEPKTCRGLHQKPIRSLKPAGFHTKNRFEARNPPRIAPKINLEPKTCRGLHQKPIRSLKPAEDWAKN